MGSLIMKTTIDISDDLLLKAKALAAKRGTTLRAVIEQGLRQELAGQKRAQPFHLSDKSVDGNGLQAEYAGKSWSDIRDAAYEGRGS